MLLSVIVSDMPRCPWYRDSTYTHFFFDGHRSVGRTKFQRVMMGGVDQELYIGRKAQELRGLLRIKYPVAHGIVSYGSEQLIWNPFLN